ncbi:protein ALP [Salix suchowensis]|nr:protein ALP [Salix suchowensis]
MDDAHFNALLNGDFEGDYDNVMDRVIEHITYGADDGNNSAYVDGGTAVSDNNDDDDDDSSDDDDDDENEDEANFIRRKYDDDILILSTAGALSLYYIAYIHKEPCMISYNTGMRWLHDILRGHWKHCVNMFRMDKDTLLGLCNDLETRYGLKPSRRICMKEVLKALRLFAIDIIKPTDPDFTNTPIQIAMNPRFMPHFKNCIGAIDGTHVRVMISPENQIPYIGRKGVPTQNIMATCSFDMQFTFVWAGWEGSAHDTRIFLKAIDNRSIKFPKPPEDELLPDVVACESFQSSRRNSRMDIVREGIANSLMGE